MFGCEYYQIRGTLLLLSIHVLTHRLAPADPAPPISSLSLPELDYEYVKAALQGWPVRSVALYGALGLGITPHAADGLTVFCSMWAPKSKPQLLMPSARRARRALVGAD